KVIFILVNPFIIFKIIKTFRRGEKLQHIIKTGTANFCIVKRGSFSRTICIVYKINNNMLFLSFSSILTPINLTHQVERKYQISDHKQHKTKNQPPAFPVLLSRQTIELFNDLSPLITMMKNQIISYRNSYNYYINLNIITAQICIPINKKIIVNK